MYNVHSLGVVCAVHNLQCEDLAHDDGVDDLYMCVCVCVCMYAWSCLCVQREDLAHDDGVDDLYVCVHVSMCMYGVVYVCNAKILRTTTEKMTCMCVFVCVCMCAWSCVCVQREDLAHDDGVDDQCNKSVNNLQVNVCACNVYVCVCAFESCLCVRSESLCA
jgi:hypothetical protein